MNSVETAATEIQRTALLGNWVVCPKIMNQPFRYFLNVWNLNLKEITGGFDLSSRHSLSLQTVSSVLSHSLLPAVFTFLFSSIFDMQGFIATGCDFSSHIFLNYTEICQIFPLSLANMWPPPTFRPLVSR